VTASDTDAALVRRLRRLRGDLPLYAAECLRIRDKAGALVPLELNAAQRFLHARMEDQKRRTGKVRCLIGKGRQTGGSTYVGARFYHRTSMRPGVKCYILCHEQEASDTLFDMVDCFHANNPLAPSTGASNAKELIFNKLGSGYSVGTAGTKAAGRSSTNHLLHWSEVAYSPNAAGHSAGLVQTVPDLPGTEIVKESTGNGPEGEFYESWQVAEAGMGDYEALFLPWFWSEDYARDVETGCHLDEEERRYAGLHKLSLGQMAWRRAKISELKSEILFRREYPATATEMWAATGRQSYIDPETVLTARKHSAEGLGPLVIGVDPARFGDDRFSVAWRRGRKVSKVESRIHIGTTEALAWLRDIIDQDKPARMFIDAGGGGDRLFDLLHAWGKPYSDVVVLVNFGSSPQTEVLIAEDGTRRAGPKNRRAEMWMRLKEWLGQTGGADIPDSDALQADAIGPGYHYSTTDQRLVLESKEQMRARGVRSPDEADAVVLTFAEPVKERPADRRPPMVRTVQASGEASTAWLGA
jgi:hypothetical protein